MASGFKTATVNAADVPGTLSNFPVYVDLSRLGITTQAEADSVRVYADSGKTTEWAREIVSVTEMHVKIPSLTSTTAIYVDWDGTSSDYADGDTYGRNAVWSAYYGVWHLEGTAGTAQKVEDATGNSRNFTEGGSPTSTAGLMGGSNGGYNMVGANTGVSTDTGYDWLQRPSGLMSDIGSSSVTISLWFKPDYISTSAAWRLMNCEANGAAGQPSIFTTLVANSGDNGSNYNKQTSSANFLTNTSVFSAGAWSFTAFGYNSGTTFPFLVSNTSDTDSVVAEGGTFAAATAPFYINRRYNTTYSSARVYGDGNYDEIRVILVDNSGNWLTTEYNNQSDESGFWGTWSDVSGGGGGAGAYAGNLNLLGVG